MYCNLVIPVFRTWRRLYIHVFTKSSHWFLVLFSSVVIGQSDLFGFGLLHSIENRSIMQVIIIVLSSWRIGPSILFLHTALSLAVISASLHIPNPSCMLSLSTVLLHVSLSHPLLHLPMLLRS